MIGNLTVINLSGAFGRQASLARLVYALAVRMIAAMVAAAGRALHRLAFIVLRARNGQNGVGENLRADRQLVELEGVTASFRRPKLVKNRRKTA